MSGLLERMRCRVVDCARARALDSDVCTTDLAEKWANRLARQPDGSYLRRRVFTAREETWRAA
jgi:hypothetical protein